MNEQDQEDRMIGALLRIPFEETIARVQERLAEAGYDDLRPAHLAVFQHLPQNGAHLTTLAASTQMTKQSMGALVDYLEEHGYVRRMADPSDRRVWQVVLTPRGAEVTRAARSALKELELEWAAHLGSSRFKELYATLQDLVGLIEGEE